MLHLRRRSSDRIVSSLTCLTSARPSCSLSALLIRCSNDEFSSERGKYCGCGSDTGLMSVRKAKLYRGVIDDVINMVREAFNEEGIDEQVLQDLKTTWEKRLSESKAVDSKEADAPAAGSTPARGARGSAAANRAAAAAAAAAAASAAIAAQHQPLVQPSPGPHSLVQAGFQAQLTAGLPVGRSNQVVQLDGPHDSSEEEEDEEDGKDGDEEHEDNDEEKNEEENDSPGEDEEPLNSEDDVSDEEPNELFETDNVVVCQYDKVCVSEYLVLRF